MPVAIPSPRCLNLNQKCFLVLPTSMGETTPGWELSYCCGWNSPLPQFQLRLDSSNSNLSSCLLRPAHLYSTLGCSAFFFGSFESSQPSIRNPFIMVSFTWVLLVCATCFRLRPHCSKVCHAGNDCGSASLMTFPSLYLRTKIKYLVFKYNHLNHVGRISRTDGPFVSYSSFCSHGPIPAAITQSVSCLPCVSFSSLPCLHVSSESLVFLMLTPSC